MREEFADGHVEVRIAHHAAISLESALARKRDRRPVRCTNGLSIHKWSLPPTWLPPRSRPCKCSVFTMFL